MFVTLNSYCASELFQFHRITSSGFLNFKGNCLLNELNTLTLIKCMILYKCVTVCVCVYVCIHIPGSDCK